MPNPVLALIEKHAGAYFVPRAKRVVLGLAHDFWHDGDHNPALSLVPSFVWERLEKIAPALSKKKHPQSKSESNSATPTPTQASAAAAKPAVPLWTALPGEISEKMWGVGSVTPLDEIITEAMVQPLGLNKDMSVLDLSSGLGGRLRQMVDAMGIYITGLEPDPQIAARGMEMSVRAGKKKHAEINAYNPDTFNLTKKYDCILARETFYRVTDRAKFFAALAACSKPGAQIAYTDYIVNPEHREQPAILAWQKFEAGAHPLSLVESAEAWAKVGYTIRVHEDLTDIYKKEVMAGMMRLTSFLASGINPDAATKKQILKRVETWVRRVSAIDQGMRFYRFYGSR